MNQTNLSWLQSMDVEKGTSYCEQQTQQTVPAHHKDKDQNDYITSVINKQNFRFQNELQQQVMKEAIEYLKIQIENMQITPCQSECKRLMSKMAKIIGSRSDFTSQHQFEQSIKDCVSVFTMEYYFMQNFDQFLQRKGRAFEYAYAEPHWLTNDQDNFNQGAQDYQNSSSNEGIMLLPDLQQAYESSKAELENLLNLPQFHRKQQLVDSHGTILRPKDLPQELKDNYTYAGYLGEGGYSQVFKFIDNNTNQPVAIKIINLFYNLIDTKRVLRELFIHRSLSHSNLMKIQRIFYNKDINNFDKIYVVMDYYPFSLYDLLYVFKENITWSHELIRIIFAQITNAVAHLHSRNIIHRDIKPSNILIDQNLNVILADYTLSRTNRSKQAYCNINVGIQKSTFSETKSLNSGSRWYRAPELILLCQQYDQKSDMWSLGCLYAEMLQHLDEQTPVKGALFPGRTCNPLTPPNKDDDNFLRSDQLYLILEKIGKPKKEECKFIDKPNLVKYVRSINCKPFYHFTQLYFSTNFQEQFILQNTLQFSPNHRISAEQLLSIEYFKIFNREDLYFHAENPIFIDFQTPIKSESTLSLEEYRILFIRELSFYNIINGYDLNFQDQINNVLAKIEELNSQSLWQTYQV